MPNLNLSGVETKTGTTGGANPGAAMLVIDKSEEKTIGSKNTPAWEVTFMVGGTSIRKAFFLTEKAKPFLKGFLNVLSVQNANVLDKEEIESGCFDDNKIVGCTIWSVLVRDDKGYISTKFFDSQEKCEAYKLTTYEARDYQPSGSTNAATVTPEEDNLPF